MKKLKKTILFFMLTILPTVFYAANTPPINTLAKEFMQQNQVPGMSIAIIEQDSTTILNYGYADDSKKIPVTNNTLYTIASFTKTFTATLAAIAAEQGKLNLQAPVVNYFPALKPNPIFDTITTQELLGHVSSLPFNFSPRPQNYQDMLNDLLQFKPTRQVGSEYSYSNASIGIVGYILQNVYQQDYQTILNNNLLQPLNMHETYLVVPKDRQKDMAVGHEDNNQIVPVDPKIDVWFAAANLKSSISDMAQYLAAHMNVTPIHDSNLTEAIAMAHHNNYCFANQLACEQLAWQAHVITELKNSSGDTYFTQFDKNQQPLFNQQRIVNNANFAKNRIFIDKTGSGYGMSSYMIYIPDKKMGVVILLNKNIGDARIRLGRDILLNLQQST